MRLQVNETQLHCNFTHVMHLTGFLMFASSCFKKKEEETFTVRTLLHRNPENKLINFINKLMLIVSSPNTNKNLGDHQVSYTEFKIYFSVQT